MSDDPATTNLFMAYSYLERVEGLLGKDRPEELDQMLRFASKHLAETRKHDAYATISVIEGKQTVTYTFDQLAAQALYYQGFLENITGVARERAKDALQKAASYAPNDPRHYTELAKLYARQQKRADALEALQEALRIDPSYFPALNLLNKFQDNPNIGRNTYPLLMGLGWLIILPTVPIASLAFLAQYLNGQDTTNAKWALGIAGVIFLLIHINMQRNMSDPIKDREHREKYGRGIDEV